MVSAVIDLDELYRDAGLYARDLPIDVAISGRDGQGQDDAQLLRRRAGVRATIR